MEYFRYTHSLLTYSTEKSPWEANRFSASQEIPRILWNPKFITAFTSARPLSLSWASLIQSILPHPTSWRSIWILSSHLSQGLPKDLFPSGFSTKTVYSSLPHHTRYVPRPSHSSRFLWPERCWVSSTDRQAPIMWFFGVLYLCN